MIMHLFKIVLDMLKTVGSTFYISNPENKQSIFYVAM